MTLPSDLDIFCPFIGPPAMGEDAARRFQPAPIRKAGKWREIAGYPLPTMRRSAGQNFLSTAAPGIRGRPTAVM